MAALTTQNIGYAGTAPTFGAASVSDTAEVGPRNFIVYKNTGTAKTVTVQVPSSLTPYTQANNDVTYALGATTGELWIPLHSDYNSGSGRATVTVDVATAVTVAAVKAGWTE